ncbi:MAG TPA: hypothetical protein VJJ22_04065 [Candidatus Paceibacterota bacterium]
MEDEPEDLPNLRTYQQDMANSIKEGNLSIANIALAEQKRRAETKSVETETRGNKWLVFLIAIFVLAGTSVLSYALFLRQTKVEVPPATTLTLPRPLVQTQKQTIFELGIKSSDTAYLDLALMVKTQSGTPNSIEEIIVSRDTVILNAEQFFNSVGIPIPERVIRFVDKRYMFGIYRLSEQSAFLILRPTSFGPVFSEMLNWESVMPDYLYPLLAGKTLPDGTKLSWENYVIRSVDVREGKTTNGEIKLLYSFLPDKSTLIIATNLNTFEEVLLRSQSPTPITQ